MPCVITPRYAFLLSKGLCWLSLRYTHRYLAGNFAPVRKEVHTQELKVIGALPAGLEGVFARTGPNPEQLAGDYHWCAGLNL